MCTVFKTWLVNLDKRFLDFMLAYLIDIVDWFSFNHNDSQV